jgi:DNA polymerase I-like protein with 3'-5' exonuclease and polymerase domains
VKKPVVVDFETAGIQARPEYPPKPVGVSIQLPSWKKSRYYAWGHPTNNNCTIAQPAEILKDCVRAGLPMLFHNAKFDVDVMTTHMGVPMPTWGNIHDTQFLLFLLDPHATTHSLKPSAHRILGMAPEEQDAVKQWLVTHGIVRANQSDWGAYICRAPGDLVGRYADGDVLRTRLLFEKLHPEVVELGMQEAYDRERELMPILLENETQGILVDADTLSRDVKAYRQCSDMVDEWLRKRLKSPGLNIDSDRDLADALDSAGIVSDWVLTKTGQRSVAKKNMTPDMFKDPRVASALGYRNRLQTCLGTFMEPWLEMASSTGGRIHTSWNQVRQNRTDKTQGGTRTGRMSCTPNFQNIPKDWYDKGDGYVHPDHLKVPPLPKIRGYVLPDKGQVFCSRDYSQQELRVLAHFEDDKLMSAYHQNPKLDVHDFVKDAIREITGIELSRRHTKIINFGLVYGMGLGKLAEDMGVEVDFAKQVKAAQGRAVPGLKKLSDEIKNLVKHGEPIVTWGGRHYHPEPPKMVNGRMMSFEYKLLNYLIQGSSADCTKQAIINYHHVRKNGRFLVTVHDEVNISVPPKAVKSEMKLLRDAMADVAFDIPMVSDGSTGPTWGDIKEYEV